MIRLCKYNVTVVKEDEYMFKVEMNFLREDLGWKWIPTTEYYTRRAQIEKKLAHLREKGYEVLKES